MAKVRKSVPSKIQTPSQAPNSRDIDNDEVGRPPQAVVRPVDGHLGSLKGRPTTFLEDGHDGPFEAQRDRGENRRVVLSDEAHERICSERAEQAMSTTAGKRER